MSGEGYGIGTYGANQGFGYLNDDDDDGTGAGSLPATFDILDGGVTGTVARGSTWTQDCAATATGSSQTNASFSVAITLSSNDDFGLRPSTYALDGWTETGWSTSDTGFNWSNTFTRDPLAIGVTHPKVSFSPTLYGGGSISLTAVLVHTDQVPSHIGFGTAFSWS